MNSVVYLQHSKFQCKFSQNQDVGVKAFCLFIAEMFPKYSLKVITAKTKMIVKVFFIINKELVFQNMMNSIRKASS